MKGIQLNKLPCGAVYAVVLHEMVLTLLSVD